MRADIAIETDSLSRNLFLEIHPADADTLSGSTSFSAIESEPRQIALLRGDNLSHLLRLHSTKVEFDLIYIDPPYNTLNSFLYNDSIIGGQSPVWGSHAAWLAFMLPRLIAAKHLLSNAGVIAVSIDENEGHYLKILMDRIFGEENNIGNVIVCKSKNGTGSNKNIATNHEHLLIFGKSSESKSNGLPAKINKFKEEDAHGRYSKDGLFRKKGEQSKREDRPNLFYPIYYDKKGRVFTENFTGKLKSTLPIDSSGIERRWIWSKEKANKECWRLYASPKGIIYVKNYYSDDKRTKLRSIWDNSSYLTSAATNEITSLFGAKLFDTPKPVKLIEDIILCFTHQDSMILDFFAGSGTTAHAAQNVNLIDGGQRRVVLIESDSVIPASHIAHKMGYRVISDITQARIEKIKTAN
jgi:adenine-specific DNA-methyltransferase